jgi:hypothetical protein
MSTTFDKSTSGKLSDLNTKVVSFGVWSLEMVQRRIHINRGRVGEERGGKEMDGCPLTGCEWMNEKVS